MIQKIKQWLRNWLLKSDENPSTILAVHYHTEQGIVREDYQITGASGMHLVGSSGTKFRMIPIHEAIDFQQWRCLWLCFSGGAGLHWEDGTPFTP